MNPGVILTAVLALVVSILISATIYTAKQYQIPPTSLETRSLTCAKQPRLCSIDDGRAPDLITAHGRWRKASIKANVGDENGVFFKRWNYVSISDDRYFIGSALVKFYYIADVFLYVVDKKTQDMFMYAGRLPFGLGLDMAPSSVNGCSRWGTPKTNMSEGTRPWIEICGSTTDGIRFRANVPVTQDGSSRKVLRARVDVTMQGNEDLILAYPMDGDNNRLVYAHKLAGAEVGSGSVLQLGDAIHEFTSATAGLDWTKGRLLYRTFWRWVSLNDAHASVSRGGNDPQTEILGINLSQFIYDVASNADVYSVENAIWLNGKVYVLSHPIEVTVPANPKTEMWTVRSVKPSTSENVDLQFKPWGAREDHTNFVIAVSDFIQPFGKFHGTISLKDPVSRETIQINVNEKTAFGVVENHMAYW